LKVVALPAEPEFPDAVFIEDTAVVVDELVIVTRMGLAKRRAETRSVSEFLSKYYPVKYLIPPATLDGGDVIRAGKMLYVGLSGRTNEHGVASLRSSVEPYGYSTVAVRVTGCLHLSTGCSYVGRNTMLANTNWIDTTPMAGFKIIEVPPEEPWAANVIAFNDVILLPDSFPQTRILLDRHGFDVQTVDISEFQKAEGGLSCLSLRLNGLSPSRVDTAHEAKPRERLA
jgi:dimethylargininase